MSTHPAARPTRCLESDHRALDATLVEAEQAACANQPAARRRKVASLASGLRRHIEAEETVLFPLLEEEGSHAAGPLAVMRREHRDIESLLDRLEADFTGASPGWNEDFERLRRLLAAHNAKEEQVLYPMSDDVAERAGRGEELARRLTSALEPVSG
jgi:iron-sulfur cluster repair protein YtfE (RIC family)